MAKLKPCPFCGREAVNREKSHGHTGSGEFTARFHIGCENCGIGFECESRFRINGSELVFIHDGYEKAKEKWNRRVENV